MEKVAAVGVGGGVEGKRSGSSAGLPALVRVTMSLLVARTFLRLGSPRMFFNQRNVRKRPLAEDEAPPEELVAKVKFRVEPDLKDFFFFRRSPIEGQAEALALVEVVGEGQATAVSGSTEEGSLPLLARGIIASEEGAEGSGTTTAGLTLLLLLLLLLVVVVVLANGWSKFELLTVFTR